MSDSKSPQTVEAVSQEIQQLTIADIVERTGLAKGTLYNYTTGRREPKLDVSYQPGPGGVQARIEVAVFNAWWAEYSAKKPFGSKLHKSRQGK